MKYPPNTIIANIQTNNQPINPDLYNHYAAGLRKGINNTFFEDSGSGLSDIMRANVSRFAAYKAAHVTTALKSILNDNSMTVKERNAYAKKALKVFQNRQTTEQATAIARARTAKQFEEFLSDDNNRLFPNLRWLPSSAVIPRSSHMEFYHRVWAKTDPFWATNSPGQEWNCQCDVAETADSETNNAAVPQPRPKKGLEGNPGIKEINGEPNPYYGQAFTDNASYIVNSGRNRKERDQAEKRCENANKAMLLKDQSILELNSKTTKCLIKGEFVEVDFFQQGNEEYVHSMYGNKNMFWIKNEILKDMPEYVKKATCIGTKPSDPTHNTRLKTKRLKEHTEDFYYFSTELPNGEQCVLHLGKYRPEWGGRMYFYTITKNAPKEIIPL